MDFMKLLGTVLAFSFHPGSASKLNGQRICRRGTERPCYKIFYYQDSRRRATYEESQTTCRNDDGELLSIETENEQQLIERFIQQLQASDGDFWIGLRRSQHRRVTTAGCPSQYNWLDGSKAKFRNWHWDEPSCGAEMCVVLYHQPSAPADQGGRFMFQWNDDNCLNKNNFICKYSEEKVPVFTETGKSIHTVTPTISSKPNLPSVTDRDEKTETGLSETSVSLSDNGLYVSYILFATIPVLLMLLVATGVFCCKRVARRRKTETDSCTRQDQWMSEACPIQGPYAFSDITKLPEPVLDRLPEVMRTSICATSSLDTPCDDYENVSSQDTESGFVTNDIYETCRGQSRHARSETGWVENEIYG